MVTMDNSDVLARNLKKLRKEKKWTQQKLSRKSGISKIYISELERGVKNNPSTEVLKSLATTFGVSYGALLDNNSEKVINNAIALFSNNRFITII